jgi:hypothetical protein
MKNPLRFLLSLTTLLVASAFVGWHVSAAHGVLVGAVATVATLNFGAAPIFLAAGGGCLGVTIPTNLKLDVILDAALREFSQAILPITSFSTVFNDVMLRGTNKVVVPYYKLETAASKDFNGTYLFDSADQDSREVEVNKRKYQSLALTSAEIARQPYLNAEEIGRMKGRKLAEDVIADILSVVTLANYGAHIFSGAASTFDTDAVADIRTLLNQADWPKVGRSLILDSAYDGRLVKDDPLLHAEKSGSAEQLRSGTVKPFMGFDGYHDTNMIPANGEYLVGMAVYKSAILAAFSPIEPAEDVMANMVDYRAVTDPDSGVTLEYRQWGDPNSDTSKRVIEANYGFAKGEAAALKRIVSQS